MDKNKCNSCGESTHKCSCKNKDFTKAVIEIDNPEQITLMRKVVVPASMGDDTTVPPAIGKYHNVLLYYEANSKSYLYSSDGIPTLLTGEHGEQGPAGTVTVGTTTTGEPGSSASVENVGTPENAVLNFTVPQGPRVPEEEVQEDVDNKLDEMAEDGTLEEIISHYIYNRANMCEGISYNRLGRTIDEKPQYFDANTGSYTGMQGGVMDSATTYTYIKNHFDGSGQADSNVSKIIKIQIATGEIIQQAEVNIEHGNSIAYDRTTGHYYVTPGHAMVGEGGFKIIELNSAFSIVQSVTVAKNYDSISVDELGNLYAGFTYKSSEYAYHIYKLNKQTFAEEEDIILKSTHRTHTGQDISVNNNRIVVLTSLPNFIELFDMDGNNIDNYNINDYGFKVGEAENISTFDGSNYIFGSQMQFGSSLYVINQIFQFNIISNEANDDYAYLGNQTYKTFYVSNTSTSWNPNGSSTNPFFTIEEINSIVLDRGCTINLQTSGTYHVGTILIGQCEILPANSGTIIDCGNKNYVQFEGGKIFVNGGNKLTICGVDAYKNTELFLTGIALSKKSNDYLVGARQNSNVTIEKCTFDNTESYTNGFFYTDRSIINYDDSNTSIENLGGTRFFNGTFNFLKPIKVNSTAISKGSSFIINGGYYNEFKNIKLRFTDQHFLDFHPRYGNNQYGIFANFSASGTGNNNFYTIRLNKSGNNVELQRTNQLTFDASGVMSVNIDPTFNIIGIHVM